MTQAIAAARYSVDAPAWITGTETVSVTITAQANFTATIATVIDTTGWAGGRHPVLIEAQDADGNWGVPSAFFIDVIKPSNYLPIMEQRSE